MKPTTVGEVSAHIVWPVCRRRSSEARSPTKNRSTTLMVCNSTFVTWYPMGRRPHSHVSRAYERETIGRVMSRTITERILEASRIDAFSTIRGKSSYTNGLSSALRYTRIPSTAAQPAGQTTRLRARDAGSLGAEPITNDMRVVRLYAKPTHAARHRTIT